MKTFLSIPPPQASQYTPPEQDQAQQPSTPLTPKILLKVAAESADGPGKKGKQKYDSGVEMQQLYKQPLKYDNNRSSVDIVKSVAQKTGVDPSFLYSSAFQEGMNKAISKPDDVSDAYINAKVGKDYPVDGFYNYGLDTFGDRYKQLVAKGYLPSNFDAQFKTYAAKNEKGQPINTAAFKNNEAALTAKAAFVKDEMDRVNSYAKTKGIQLDPKAAQYFTLASFNGGFGNAQKMMDEYTQAKDKQAFIDKGLTSRGGVHKNIAPRMQNMSVASEFFK